MDYPPGLPPIDQPPSQRSRCKGPERACAGLSEGSLPIMVDQGLGERT